MHEQKYCTPLTIKNARGSLAPVLFLNCAFVLHGHISKRKRWRDRFNLALANQQSLFYFASYFASVLNPSS